MFNIKLNAFFAKLAERFSPDEQENDNVWHKLPEPKKPFKTVKYGLPKSYGRAIISDVGSLADISTKTMKDLAKFDNSPTIRIIKNETLLLALLDQYDSLAPNDSRKAIVENQIERFSDDYHSSKILPKYGFVIQDMRPPEREFMYPIESTEFTVIRDVECPRTDKRHHSNIDNFKDELNKQVARLKKIEPVDQEMGDLSVEITDIIKPAIEKSTVYFKDFNLERNTRMNNEDERKAISDACDHLKSVLLAKNHDYGNSFGETFQELGPVSGFTRFIDKTNRLKQLVNNNKQDVLDESITDTWLDAAGYSILNLIETEKWQNKDSNKKLIDHFNEQGQKLSEHITTKKIAQNKPVVDSVASLKFVDTFKVIDTDSNPAVSLFRDPNAVEWYEPLDNQKRDQARFTNQGESQFSLIADARLYYVLALKSSNDFFFVNTKPFLENLLAIAEKYENIQKQTNGFDSIDKQNEYYNYKHLAKYLKTVLNGTDHENIPARGVIIKQPDTESLYSFYTISEDWLDNFLNDAFGPTAHGANIKWYLNYLSTHNIDQYYNIVNFFKTIKNNMYDSETDSRLRNLHDLSFTVYQEQIPELKSKARLNLNLASECVDRNS